jgi:hypothetical protein
MIVDGQRDALCGDGGLVFRMSDLVRGESFIPRLRFFGVSLGKVGCYGEMDGQGGLDFSERSALETGVEDLKFWDVAEFDLCWFL